MTDTLTTTEIVECAECWDEVAISQAVACDGDGVAPWLCEACADDYVVCEDCGAYVAPGVAVARDSYGEAPWLCPECAKYCCDCSEAITPQSIAVARDGDDCAPWLCEACADDYVACGDCERLVSTDDAVARDGDDCAPWLCPECALRCNDCGHVINPQSDAVARDDDDQAPWLCPECVPEDSTDPAIALYSYSYRPTPKFHGTAGRVAGTPYLGLELEVEANSEDDGRSIVSATDDSHDLFYCKADASLDDCGVEIVTHPMTIGYAREFDWEDLCSTLSKHGKSWDTGSCGIHVHLSRDSMTRSHLWRFARLLNGNPEQFGKLAGRTGSRWARFADDFKPVSKAIAGKGSNPDRYSALNLQNSATVEVRIFRGTLHPVGVRTALEVVHAMWAYTAGLTFSEVQNGALGFDSFRSWVEASTTYPALVERMAGRLAVTPTPDLAAAA